MVTCARVRDESLAEKYVLGELSEADREAFEKHYFECDDCCEDSQTYPALLEELQRRAASIRAERPRPAALPRWATGRTRRRRAFPDPGRRRPSRSLRRGSGHWLSRTVPCPLRSGADAASALRRVQPPVDWGLDRLRVGNPHRTACRLLRSLVPGDRRNAQWPRAPTHGPGCGWLLPGTRHVAGDRSG